MSVSIRRRVALVVAGAFSLSGVVHLARPTAFAALMPRNLPRQKEVNYLFGAAELVCAVGLFRDQDWAGPASAGVLIAVWPGNLIQAKAATEHHGLRSKPAAIAWARIPLQLPMIWAVWPHSTHPTEV